jgi:hypothetical protein
MKDLNWNIFKVKFNGKERNAFESLSYQLFFVGYNNKIGLFQFKNQTSIEAENWSVYKQNITKQRL